MKTLVLAAILSLAAAVRRGASECVRKGIPLPPARPLLNVSRLSAEGQKRRFRCGLKKARDRRERSKSRPLTYVRFLEPRRALGTADMGAASQAGVRCGIRDLLSCLTTLRPALSGRPLAVDERG